MIPNSTVICTLERLFTPGKKSTFKYEVGSSWCPVLLPLKSVGDLPATGVEEADTRFARKKCFIQV